LEVFEAIAKRRSIRKYVPMPVPEEKLRKVLEAAQAAPSASNRQEYKLIVVTEEETKKRLVRAAADQGFLAEAGVVIVACATDPSRKWHAVDIAIAIDHMTLAALELGARVRNPPGRLTTETHLGLRENGRTRASSQGSRHPG